MDVLSILAIGTLCIACFYVGAKVGQTIKNGETVELPQMNPITTIQERVQERREKKKEMEEKAVIETLLHNIDVYDGTGIGQKDIPR